MIKKGFSRSASARDGDEFVLSRNAPGRTDPAAGHLQSHGAWRFKMFDPAHDSRAFLSVRYFL
jgi:hypothetical protein